MQVLRVSTLFSLVAEYIATRKQSSALLATPLTLQYSAARLVTTQDVSFCIQISIISFTLLVTFYTKVV